MSLLTDLSSEMIYPLLPVFVSQVLGAGAFGLGVIEAVAETTASLLKIFSGYITDRTGRRKPLVVVGYSLSSLMRPLIGTAVAWPQVLFFRFMDRVGKGLRTSPRDALIADVTAPGIRGRAYGFHRAMDHLGAVLGPLVAVVLLKGLGFDIRTVFLSALVPAIAVIYLVIFLVKEQAQEEESGVSRQTVGLKASPWKRDFKLFLLAVVVFTLGNSTDAFIILRLNTEGVSPAGAALLWSGFHVVKMLSTYYGGRLSDRFGKKRMLLIGWFYYSGIYLLFGLLTGKAVVIGLFLLYGVYFGFTEPVERAWVAHLVSGPGRGRAFGFYHAAVGGASLPASLLFGWLWQQYGYPVAFFAGGLLAAVATVIVSFVKEEGQGKEAEGGNPSAGRT